MVDLAEGALAQLLHELDLLHVDLAALLRHQRPLGSRCVEWHVIQGTLIRVWVEERA